MHGRSRAASMDDEVVEESIECHDDDDGNKNIGGGLQLTRQTRSHYDLHSKKETRGPVSRGPSQALRGPSRVPLQPRISTPPCASSEHQHRNLSSSSCYASGSSLAGSGAGGSVAGGAGAGGAAGGASWGTGQRS